MLQCYLILFLFGKVLNIQRISLAEMDDEAAIHAVEGATHAPFTAPMV